jgi:hypothetical protein
MKSKERDHKQNFSITDLFLTADNMKLPKEFLNGIIFCCNWVFFLLMNAVGLGHLFYLRLINVFFVFMVLTELLKWI